jgi:hypothetical protein
MRSGPCSSTASRSNRKPIFSVTRIDSQLPGRIAANRAVARAGEHRGGRFRCGPVTPVRLANRPADLQLFSQRQEAAQSDERSRALADEVGAGRPAIASLGDPIVQPRLRGHLVRGRRHGIVIIVSGSP